MRADPSQDRRKSEVKERHVIIEKVAILHEVARPPPYNVEMLGLVAVVAVAEDIRRLGLEEESSVEPRCRAASPTAAARVRIALIRLLSTPNASAIRRDPADPRIRAAWRRCRERTDSQMLCRSVRAPHENEAAQA